MGLFDAIAGLAGAGLGAASTYYGAQTAADAAKKAGKQQLAMFEQTRADYEPWRQAGLGALGDLSDIILRGDSSKFQTSPGYDFRLAEGQKAIDRSAASRGRLMSGATLKALDRYGQDVASDEYDNYLNQLARIAGYGQTATRDVAGFGAGAADRAGQYTADAGAIRGTGYAYGGAGLANNLLGLYGYFS